MRQIKVQPKIIKTLIVMSVQTVRTNDKTKIYREQVSFLISKLQILLILK